MSVLPAVAATALVPVPVLPPEPATGGLASPAVLVLGVLACAAAIAFAKFVVRFLLDRTRTRRPALVGALLATAVGATVVPMAWLDMIDRDAREERHALWSRDAAGAEARALTAVAETYGLTFTSTAARLPAAGEPPHDEPVRLADGTTTTCWFAVEDGGYAVACGRTEATARPLAPAAAAP